MNITITPGLLKGAVTPPPSKSQAHRLLIAAALAEGESVLSNVALSQDISATIRCLEALGASFRREGDAIAVTGLGNRRARGGELPRLDCGESGSTLRFLIPVALALRGGGVFTGQGRLMDRPQGPYFDLFREKGIFYEQKDGVLTVRGELTAGEYALPGNVSSQFFTGLLFALPLLEGPSVLRSTTPLESGDYIAMTLDALGQFGVTFPATLSQPPQYHLPGGLSFQGDAIITKLYWTLARPGEADIDVSQCPDLVPPLAAMAALRGGGKVTRLVNAGRLRLKESDRLSAVTRVLTALGAQVEEGADSLTFVGADSLPGGAEVSAHNDHRIAMMAAIAATGCEAPVTVTGAECVAKSYPDFWEEYARLGGQLRRKDM